MDAAHFSAANGLDILLWLALLYWAPRFLRSRPVKRERPVRHATRTPAAVAEQPTLKIA